MNSLDDNSDLPTYKLTISLLQKMVFCWGGVQIEIPPLSTEAPIKNQRKENDKLRRAPLQGFDTFIKESMIPKVFQLPFSGTFNPRDGQALLVFGEIAFFHKSLYQVMGEEYTRFMGEYLLSINCPSNFAFGFVEGVKMKDKKAFKTYLQVR